LGYFFKKCLEIKKSELEKKTVEFYNDPWKLKIGLGASSSNDFSSLAPQVARI